MERETRHITAEYRLKTDEQGKRSVSGYAAVFNALSEDLGGFREMIRPGAFAKTLQEADVRALWNHDSNYPLGRVSAGTLRLWEDDHGLGFELALPETSYGRDLAESMMRGDVREMSFAFSAVRDEWESKAQPPQRSLVEVRLFEVSPVVFPAYPQTSASVRAKAQSLLPMLPNQEDAGAPGQEAHPPDNHAQARARLMRSMIKLAEVE